MHLKEEIAKKQTQMKKKKMLFYQDNAPCQKSIATIALGIASPPTLFSRSPVTAGCLQTSKECFRERDLAPMKKGYQKLRCILRPKTNHYTKKAWNC